MFLDRKLPPRPQDPAVKIGRLPLSTIEELLQAQEIVMKKLASGEITCSQAQQIDAMLETRRRLMETQELERRVQGLEQAQKLDSDKQP